MVGVALDDEFLDVVTEFARQPELRGGVADDLEVAGHGFELDAAVGRRRAGLVDGIGPCGMNGQSCHQPAGQ